MSVLFHKNLSDKQIIAKSKLFNKKWYLKNYPDIKESGTDPITHYLTIGWKKKYNPSLKFDGNAYLSVYTDVKNANMNPLLHYEKYGRKEHRRITDIQNKYRTSKIQDIFCILKRNISTVFYHKTIQKNKDTRILVILHLFYMSSWDAIKQYLNNLNQYNYDLIVTYTKGHYQRHVLQKIQKYKPNTKLFLYPNKGFDIGAFIDILRKIDLKKYDIIFKIHSKGVRRKYLYIYNQIFKNKDWFHNLYDGILGAFTVHKAINAFNTDKNIGIVASKNLIVQDPKHKQYFTKQCADKYKLKIKRNYHYIAGSCFIIRSSCLQEIKKLKLTINSFTESKRGLFSLAHSMERIVCAMIETQKYKIYGIPVKHHIYNKELKEAEKTSAIRLLQDTRVEFNYEFFYRSLESKPIISYEIKHIQLKDINRDWKGKIIKLDQCAPYNYLKGKTDIYKKYCKENKELFNIEMSKKRYDNLIDNIETNGFNTKSMPIINQKNNIIMDGQHRCCYMLSKYGPNYKIKALFVNMGSDN